MVLEYHGKTVPDIVTLCNEARDRNGYDMENGWIHDYLVTKANEGGVSAYRKEGLTNLVDIISSLEAGNPVIVSVEKRVLEQRRFHIIVLTGYQQKEDGSSVDAGSFTYHEPESTTKEKGRHRTCTATTFLEYWRGKAIFIAQA
jgi:hypothetical protein